MSKFHAPLMAALLLGIPAGSVPAEEDDSDKKNPYATERDARQGEVWLRSWCATCHGRDSRGGRGPDLTDGNFRNGSSDQAIFNTIRNGVPGSDMIALTDMDEKTIWQMVAAIRSREKPVPQPVLTPEAVEAGRRLFVKHNCSTCHWNGKEGGRRGVDLTASSASIDYVKTSILDPDANFREVPAAEQHPNQQVVALTVSGKTIVGRWLNETAYHVLLVDDQDHLHTIARGDLASLGKPRQSLMPSFAELLTDDELERLVVYVFSIRKAPRVEESN